MSTKSKLNDNSRKTLELLTSGADALGIPLDASQLEQFRIYYETLTDWNSRVNLTSITDWEEVLLRHFLDSLSVSLAISPSLGQSAKFIDIGSGGGFPGMPLKIAMPSLQATLVDSTAKKTAFLEHLTKAVGCTDVVVLKGRAETLAHDSDLRENFDLVFSRAVAGLNVLVELTLPFCRTGGAVVLQKKLGIDDEISRAHTAIETLGGKFTELKQVPVKGLEDRGLVVIEKVEPTPERYPRRPGIPAKRPL